ncbi:heavy metal translocating P-type ATPase metal-binding domain-containing protein [Bacteriovoracaceae bacterium]|nr:heavy metal translocating P-type ATPase metal-binding domain-containing protein [Bacteriovoracaceae bacterium]
MLVKNKKHYTCKHCGSFAGEDEVIIENNFHFCCHGCLTVFNCLNVGGLDNFYHLMDLEGQSPQKVTSENKVKYMADDQFLHNFGQGQNKNTFNFYVQGITCLACSWVFKNITALNEKIQNSNFQPESNILTLTMTDRSELVNVGTIIYQLGYQLVPLKNESEAENIYQKDKRNELIRIGVTAGLMMNLMIYSVAIYAGVDGSLKRIFEHIMAVMYAPILFYSAIPFLKNFMSSLKSLRFNIDLPISLSVLFGSIFSYYNYFKGSDLYYFDSIAMFIFLILSTRHFLSSLYHNQIKSNFFQNAYGIQQILKQSSKIFVYKHISDIAQGDIIKVPQGEIIPLDGVVLKGHSYVNESLLTGESTPLLKHRDSKVVSGSINLSHDLELQVSHDMNTTSFTKYLDSLKIDTSQLDSYSYFGQKYSLYLSFIFIVASAVLFLYFPQEQAIPRILSLLIVCCPCALGIGIPLVSLLKTKKLANNGILLKNKAVYEKFPNIETIFFDKTGTLTSGAFKLAEIVGDQTFLPHLISLEKHSHHPIAVFLVNHFTSVQDYLEVENFKEILGEGVEGDIQGHHYKIHSLSDESIVLMKGSQQVLKLILKEEIDPNNIQLLKDLSKKYRIEIMSGDHRQRVSDLIDLLQVNHPIKSQHSLKPEDKKNYMRKQKNSLYVGDGLNDIWAMKYADLSISLNAGELVNDNCDVVFLAGNLNKLNFFIKEIRHLHRLIQINISFSIFYNILGFILSVTGMITPLIAAVAMPISSLIVVSNSFLLSRKGRIKK